MKETKESKPINPRKKSNQCLKKTSKPNDENHEDHWRKLLHIIMNS